MNRFDMDEKIKIKQAVIVEGKYDRLKLLCVIDAAVYTADGFGIFKEKEKTALLRKMSEEKGLIVLTDPDGAGIVIRNFFSARIAKDKLIHLYVPNIKGKEKRKSTPSKEGFLGVEGMEKKLLYDLFKPFESTSAESGIVMLDSARFYIDGFTGKEDSAKKRDSLAKALNMPSGMSAKAMISAVNFLGGLCCYENALQAFDIENR